MSHTEAQRCPWGIQPEIYSHYHDTQWGVPVHDDRELFEMLILEGTQAGLSWLTILKRRDGYRAAFDNFNAQKIANYSPQHLETLRQDERIIRNRLKIKATVKNAQEFLKIKAEHPSFAHWLWSFTDGKPLVNHWKNHSDTPVKSDLSDTISKELKTRGFNFVGSVIIYSYLQAVGIINDHITTCFRWQECQNLT